MSDIDYQAILAARQQRAAMNADTARTSATHNDAQGVFDSVKKLSEGGVEALKEIGTGLVKGSPIGAAMAGAEGKPEQVPGVAGSLIDTQQGRENVAQPGVGGEIKRHELQALAPVASAAEWWGFGEMFGVAGRRVESSMPPILKGIIQTASKSVGVPMGDEEAAVVGKRTLASMLVGGGMTGAFSATEGAIRGKVSPSGIGTNVAIGALMGALGGVFDHDTNRMIAREADNIHDTLLSDAEKSDVTSFSNMAKEWGKQNGYNHPTAMKRLGDVAMGIGSDVDVASIKQWTNERPEMFTGKVSEALVKAARSGKAGIEIPTRDGIAALMEQLHRGALSAQNEPPLRLRNAIQTAARKMKAPADAPLQLRHVIAMGELVPEDHIFKAEPDRVNWPGPIGEAAPVLMTEPSFAGTAVQSGTATYELPIGGEVHNIPDAPTLKPPKVEGVDSAMFDIVHHKGEITITHGKTSVTYATPHEALEAEAHLNQHTLPAIGRLVVNGYIKPEHISDPEMAQTISSLIGDIRDDLVPPAFYGKMAPRMFPGDIIPHEMYGNKAVEEILNDPRFKLLDEHAVQFAARALELRGQEAPPFNKFIREPETGDIIRDVELPDGKVALIDKKGRQAIMNIEDAPSTVLKASLDEVLTGRGEAPLESLFAGGLPEESEAFKKFVRESKEEYMRREVQAGAESAARKYALKLQRTRIGARPAETAPEAYDVSAEMEAQARGKMPTAAQDEAIADKLNRLRAIRQAAAEREAAKGAQIKYLTPEEIAEEGIHLSSAEKSFLKWEEAAKAPAVKVPAASRILGKGKDWDEQVMLEFKLRRGILSSFEMDRLADLRKAHGGKFDNNYLTAYRDAFDKAAAKGEAKIYQKNWKAAQRKGVPWFGVADLDNPNDLKAIERALSKKAIPVEPGASPGLHPIANVIREKLFKLEKGAITFDRSKPDPLAGTPVKLLARRLGLEVFQDAKRGIVVMVPGGDEATFPSQVHAYDYMSKLTTAQRMVREHEQVMGETVAHLDPDSLKKMAIKSLGPIRGRVAAARLQAGLHIPVANLRKAAFLYRGLSRLEPGEAEPLMQRLRPVADPGTALRNRVIRQHAVLMQMGEGGRALANLAKQRGAINDYLRNYLSRRVLDGMRILKGMGVTVESIENGTAGREALQLFDSTYGGAAKEVYNTMQALGGDVAPLIEGKRYVHHWFQLKGNDPGIQDMLAEAQQLGIAKDVSELANVLNDPEGAIRDYLNAAEKSGSANQVSQYITYVNWARQKATSIAHALETERRGNSGYVNDLEAMANHYIDSVSNRLADVATFGPKDENINVNLAKITQNDAFTDHTQYVAAGIMNDVRGKVYIPMSTTSRLGGAAIRLWLGAAGPKHLFQNVLPWMRFGSYEFMKGSIQTLTHGIFFGEGREFANEIGASIGWSARELGEHPDQFLKEGTKEQLSNLQEWARKSRLPDLPKALGQAGTASLHVFLNAGRINAARIARSAFPKLLSKALGGDADALAVISETFHAKVTPEFLRGQDTETMTKLFSKEIADWEGMTYRPEDFPALARSQFGRELTRFRVFRWNLFHNIFQELNNPNYSYARRAKAIGRLMVAVPVLGSLDPTIRHKLGIGTLDSEVAYDAWTRWNKDKGNVGKSAYMLTMLAAHSGMYGLLDDAVQGFNLRNPAIAERTTTINPAIVAPAMDIWEASARAAHATMKNNPKEFRGAYQDILRTLSPSIGAGIQRHLGTRKPVRLPKQMVIREMFHAGP